jgi:hypothetical protein
MSTNIHDEVKDHLDRQEEWLDRTEGPHLMVGYALFFIASLVVAAAIAAGTILIISLFA